MESAIDTTTTTPDVLVPGATTPSGSRSYSDPSAAQATLAPSPTFRERVRGQQGSKDDHAVPTTPSSSSYSPYSSRPRQPSLSRGLSLQMPGALGRGSKPSMPSPAQLNHAAVPLSPKLDEKEIYMQSQQLSASPQTSLPRHSRGLDFSRACTNLHHSTLADKQHHGSPDSSPVMTMQQKGMPIPPRKRSMSSMMLDSPNMNGGGGSLAQERSTVSSSVGSINMLGSDSESTDSDEDASMGGDYQDQEDAIFTTPQVHKLQNPSVAPTPSAAMPQTPGAGTAWGSGAQFSPAQASLMKTIRRTRLHKTGRRSRKSSSSASNSGYSSLASPRATSPPPMRSIEGAGGNAGYFAWQANAARSRRESLALGTDGLHLSSGNDSGDEASLTAPTTPGVVRRAVTRRGNLLPKTKGFARIRAALLEEAAPEATEMRRESETIKQVRERDNSVDLDLPHDAVRPGTATEASSPSLLPAVPESAQEDFDIGDNLDSDPTKHSNHNNNNRGLGMNFAAQASRNSGGLDYWHRFDPSMRTPPPNFNRQSSSIASDINMDSPASAINIVGNSGGGLGDVFWRRPRARSSASDASDAFAPLAAAAAPSSSAAGASGMNDDVAIKRLKRRREDDFDIATIKRRAVSPGMSAQNSPVLTHSPSQRDGNGNGGWGQPPERKKDGLPSSTSGSEPVGSSSQQQLQAARSNSGGSAGHMASGVLASQGKKLGLQGMTDTNDGLMKMSIE